MRHRVDTRKLGRTSAHRLAMYRNLVTSLFEHEQVETTHAKARELRRIADRMITLGKRGDLHARRQALRVIRGRSITAKLFGELAERYANRPGGYTRLVRSRRRVGDAAEMSIVQLVEPLGGGTAAEPASDAPKKTRSKKAPAKKAGAKKAAAKKTAAKKTTAKKAPAKKASAKKTGAKKTTAKKAGAKKSPRKKKPAAKSDRD